MTRTTAQRVLIVSAAGGIGTTICELGQLGGLVMYGVEASRILECRYQLDRWTCCDDPRQVIEPAGHEHPCCASLF